KLIMKPKCELQGIHDIFNRLVLEISRKFIIEIFVVAKMDPDIIPAFQLRRHLAEPFFPEHQLIFNPRCLDYSIVYGIGSYLLTLDGMRGILYHHAVVTRLLKRYSLPRRIQRNLLAGMQGDRLDSLTRNIDLRLS